MKKHLFLEWGRRLLLVLLPISSYFWLLSFPIPRQVGLTFRYGFTTTLVLLVPLFGFSYWFPSWIGRLLGIMTTLAIFAMPLSGLWSSGQSEQYILAGLLPFSDAMNYHADAQRLIEGIPYTSFSARRPLFPAFFASIMSITKQNLQISLAILAAMTAVACYLAACEVQRSDGIVTSVFFIIVLFLFYRPLIGKILTEHIGLIFGALGFVLLWHGAGSKKAYELFTGIFFVSYALNARAGAFFVMPALIIWTTWLYKGEKRTSLRAFGWSLAAVLLGFVLNVIVFRSLAGNGVPFSNFANTVYGLVSGGNSWTHIYAEHPEVWLMEEPRLSQTIYRLSYELFKSNPMLTVMGAIKSLREFFSLEWYSAFCFIGGDKPWVQIASRIAMYGLCILGVVKGFKNKDDARSALVIFSVIGIILSIPFVPPMDTNRMRAHAAIIPFLIALPATGFSLLLKFTRIGFLSTTEKPRQSVLFPSIYGVSIIVLTILGSLMIKLTTKPPQHQLPQCPQGYEGIIVRISQGSYVQTVENDAIAQDWLPKIRINRFLLSAHNMPNWEYYPILDEVKANTLLTNTIDQNTGNFVLLIDDKYLVPEAGGVLGLCGKRDVNIQSIFYPNSVVYYEIN